MSHIYIDGTKITANANKGNDQLLTGYNIQQCKQKEYKKKITETHFFVNLGFLICCFFTAPFVERMMGIEPTRSAWKAEVLPLNYIRLSLQQIVLYHYR